MPIHVVLTWGARQTLLQPLSWAVVVACAGFAPLSHWGHERQMFATTPLGGGALYELAYVAALGGTMQGLAQAHGATGLLRPQSTLRRLCIEWYLVAFPALLYTALVLASASGHPDAGFFVPSGTRLALGMVQLTALGTLLLRLAASTPIAMFLFGLLTWVLPALLQEGGALADWLLGFTDPFQVWRSDAGSVPTPSAAPQLTASGALLLAASLLRPARAAQR